MAVSTPNLDDELFTKKNKKKKTLTIPTHLISCNIEPLLASDEIQRLLEVNK